MPKSRTNLGPSHESEFNHDDRDPDSRDPGKKICHEKQQTKYQNYFFAKHIDRFTFRRKIKKST